MNNFEYLIEKDKKEGKYDMGILGKHLSYTLAVLYVHSDYRFQTAYFIPHILFVSYNLIYSNAHAYDLCGDLESSMEHI